MAKPQLQLDPNRNKSRILSLPADRATAGGWVQDGRIFSNTGEFMRYNDSRDGNAARVHDGAVAQVTPDVPEIPAAETKGVDVGTLESVLKAKHANEIKKMVQEYDLTPATGKGSKAVNIATLISLAEPVTD